MPQKTEITPHFCIEKNRAVKNFKRVVTGENVNTVDTEGRTALHLAIQQGKPLYIQALLGIDEIDVNSPMQKRETALHQFIPSNTPNPKIPLVEKVKALMQGIKELSLMIDEIDVNSPTQKRKTALHQFIPSNTPNPEIPLEKVKALMQGIVKELSLMIDEIDVNSPTQKRKTALHQSIPSNTPNPEIPLVEEVKALMKGIKELSLMIDEIDVNSPTQKRETALHQSIPSNTPNPEVISLVKHLLAKEAKVNTVYDQGNTPLLMALKRKDDIGIQIAQLLLSSGKLSQENIKAVGAQGSAIHYAVSQPKQEDALSLVTSLIEKGADIDQKVAMHGQKNITALHAATVKCYPLLVKLLQEKGANMHALDQDNGNALRWAIKTAGKHSKYKEKYNNAEEIVSTLLDAKLDPNIQDTGGRTTLHETVEHSLEAIVKILLAHNADATIQDENGYTPLHIATRVGRNFQIVKLLSQYKAPLDACSTDGETPLHFAVRIDNKRMRTEHAILFSTTLEFGGSRIRIVRYLLEKGANANPLTRQKKENPLHYLMRYYNESNKKTANKIIELLITYGVNPNQKNTDNKMPVDLAPEACREYIQTAIEKAQQSLQSSITNATDEASRDWSTPSFGG